MQRTFSVKKVFFSINYKISQAFLSVVSHLTPTEQLELRLVCKACNELLVKRGSPLLCKLQFTVCNDESRDTLLNSVVPWESISFRQYLVEKSLFGNENHFLTFRKRFAGTLKVLQMRESILGMGRFVELISFCTALEELYIFSCPALLHSGFEIINWHLFIPKFHANLSKLKTLAIEDAYHITDISLDALTSEMTRLERFLLSTEVSRLPVNVIEKVVRNNAKSLTVLGLSGPDLSSTKKFFRSSQLERQEVIHFWGKMATLELPKLSDIHLSRMSLWNGFDFSNFLDRCKNLKKVLLSDMHLPSDIFANCRKLRYSLEMLRIADCNLEQRTVRCLTPYENLKEIIFIHNNSTDKEDNRFSYPDVAPLFGSLRPLCTKLVFRCRFGSELICLIAHNFPNLKVLDFQMVENIKPQELLSLRFLKNLKILVLKGCEIMDSTFFPYSDNDKDLAHLCSLFRDGLQGTLSMNGIYSEFLTGRVYWLLLVYEQIYGTCLSEWS